MQSRTVGIETDIAVLVETVRFNRDFGIFRKDRHRKTNGTRFADRNSRVVRAFDIRGLVDRDIESQDADIGAAFGFGRDGQFIGPGNVSIETYLPVDVFGVLGVGFDTD
jgi:hypothetical protein